MSHQEPDNTFAPDALQRLYQRLHTHYIGVYRGEDVEESMHVHDLADPEAFYKELSTFAYLIMTHPTSARTQALARTYDAHLGDLHAMCITDLQQGRPTSVCICMHQFVHGKCVYYRDRLTDLANTEEERMRAEENLRAWKECLMLIQSHEYGQTPEETVCVSAP